MNLENLVTGILENQTRAVARAISIVENRPESALLLLQSIFPHTGKALTIGITGSPGAGKSSLVDKLALNYRQKLDDFVGIIAVDPSSPFSGGAILGDRIRMQTLGLDPKVFIRSMATRGNLGGLARATTDAVSILDAAGYNKIIVETVGVGQDEIDIVKAADVCIVVLVPGMGDDIQAVKAGIMEIADVYVINKADHEGVYRTEKELESLLSITERSDGWTPPIIKTVALEGTGVESLNKAISDYCAFQQKHQNAQIERRKRISQERIIEILKDQLLTKVLSKTLSNGELNIFAQEVVSRRRDPYSIAEEICSRLNL